MRIEKVFAAIRQSDIGKVMYKAKPGGNFLGVFGLKRRPPDEEFLQTGTLADIGFAPVVNQSYKRFRQSIPKDFVVLAYPECFTKTGEKIFVHNQFQMIDLDIYTYLVTIKAIVNDKIPIESTNYNNLFYSDGRFVDYTNILNENIYNCSFILGEGSSLVPYIYKKQSAHFFNDDTIEDTLANFKSCFPELDVQTNFESLQLLSSIPALPT
jgi:hypothetical protein